MITWKVPCDTPTNQMHVYFVYFFTSQAIFEEIASMTSLAFAPGLLDVLKTTARPAIDYLKGLPIETKGAAKRWAIYILVLENVCCRPRIYIGSGTDGGRGIQDRFMSYGGGRLLPAYVENALKKGYTISHYGLLCWSPLPTPGLQPRLRLLILALEAAFSYVFWAMRIVNVKNDYGMSHICLWDRASLGYDSLCSHCSLYEGVNGDYDLSAEELWAAAAEKSEKHKVMVRENSSNWHFKQMETSYDEYLDAKLVGSNRYQAEHGEEIQERATANHRENQTYYCELCKKAFSEATELNRHNESKGHLRKAEDLAAKAHVCTVCSWASDKKGYYDQHLKSKRHLKSTAALAGTTAAMTAQPSFQLDQGQICDIFFGPFGQHPFPCSGESPERYFSLRSWATILSLLTMVNNDGIITRSSILLWTVPLLTVSAQLIESHSARLVGQSLTLKPIPCSCIPPYPKELFDNKAL
jgi:hypothetical protein